MTTLLEDLPTIINPDDAPCIVRGCPDGGEFFLQRVLRSGGVQRGLYCNDHDQQYGVENLRRWAKETHGTLGEVVDVEGTFPAVINRDDAGLTD